ncbi:hypothetical protein K4L44_09390 [Halosquirtibacter laminarini]|uniref:Uncharacterized protein n=1 Tax=Halosquirtibacter laminarini TaxID=3374600 RepID=A0AC61NBF6_9BACT|nr:hypothetical protein K4L44_09390 [Prolixibacteraceae bacterium]
MEKHVSKQYSVVIYALDVFFDLWIVLASVSLPSQCIIKISLMEYYSKLSFRYIIVVATLIFCANSCNDSMHEKPMKLLAKSTSQWTGVAVSSNGRVFVNYPKWSESIPMSVAEIVRGDAMPFPDEVWNAPNSSKFVSVQSVFVDDKDQLWILDTRNPMFKGVLLDGPILYRFNLMTNQLVRSYKFPRGNYHTNSYFNDVRIDNHSGYAFITDSGSGAIVVLNLETGASKRWLEKDPSTKFEVDHLVCKGATWNGKVDVDGLALTPDREYLFYAALSGHSLYKISTKMLTNFNLDEQKMATAVIRVGTIPATDGMAFDKKGYLWLGGLEQNTINRRSPDGTIQSVWKDDHIKWADSFAIDENGFVYFTTSQIHLKPKQRGAYRLYQFHPDLLKE